MHGLSIIGSRGAEMSLPGWAQPYISAPMLQHQRSVES